MMDLLYAIATYSAWMTFGGLMFLVGFFCGGFMMRLTGSNLK